MMQALMSSVFRILCSLNQEILNAYFCLRQHFTQEVRVTCIEIEVTNITLPERYQLNS